MVARLCVLTAVDTVLNVAGIRDLLALVDVLAGDAVPRVARGAPPTPPRTVWEAAALGPSKAGVGETAIYRQKHTRY